MECSNRSKFGGGICEFTLGHIELEVTGRPFLKSICITTHILVIFTLFVYMYIQYIYKKGFYRLTMLLPLLLHSISALSFIDILLE